jgi:hypothetical protein
MLENVISQIDEQIAKLQQARALLAGGATAPARVGSLAGTAKAAKAPTSKKRRKMTAAGRKAIAEAQRKRWAAINATKKAK